MLSRRSFMRVTSGTAATALVQVARAQRGETTAPSSRLPQSIESLQSMTGQVRPFGNQEREVRLERARRLMATEKIDAIVLSGGASPLYFANVQFGGGERLWALVIPMKANPFIVCPAFEEDRARVARGHPLGTGRGYPHLGRGRKPL